MLAVLSAKSLLNFRFILFSFTEQIHLTNSKDFPRLGIIMNLNLSQEIKRINERKVLKISRSEIELLY
jgi:hypothetical protein